MSALPQKRKAVDARRALPHSQHPFNHLLLGEVLSEGKGRPAPVVITRLAPPPRTVLLLGAGPSLQALIVVTPPRSG